MVGLDASVCDKFPSELSGGMTKRVALARALALDPEIVFLDEPTSGLDPIGAGDFDTLIATLQRTLGLTVFMVTHDLDSLHTVCDRIAVLADGKVIAAGTMDTMLASHHPWLQGLFPRQAVAGGRMLEAAKRLSRSRSMETRANYVLIGLFTLAVVVGVFGFVYWFQNIGGTGERAYLPRGVRRLGVRPAHRRDRAVQRHPRRRSHRLTLDPEHPQQVVATISVDKAVKLRADTVVGLEFHGLTGIAAMALQGGSAIRRAAGGIKGTIRRCSRRRPAPRRTSRRARATRCAGSINFIVDNQNRSTARSTISTSSPARWRAIPNASTRSPRACKTSPADRTAKAASSSRRRIRSILSPTNWTNVPPRSPKASLCSPPPAPSRSMRSAPMLTT